MQLVENQMKQNLIIMKMNFKYVTYHFKCLSSFTVMVPFFLFLPPSFVLLFTL